MPFCVVFIGKSISGGLAFLCQCYVSHQRLPDAREFLHFLAVFSLYTALVFYITQNQSYISYSVLLTAPSCGEIIVLKLLLRGVSCLVWRLALVALLPSMKVSLSSKHYTVVLHSVFGSLNAGVPTQETICCENSYQHIFLG